ncbi:MAG: hypothetical protein SWH78_07215 [Thermodesulfobacteriota bacterium]|nr:hypothetical protein [Thermodesulfobacteriota bacterium]
MGKGGLKRLAVAVLEPAYCLLDKARRRAKRRLGNKPDGRSRPGWDVVVPLLIRAIVVRRNTQSAF